MCCSPSLRMTSHFVFGNFNIDLEKPSSADFISLLASFDLKQLITKLPYKGKAQYTHLVKNELTLVMAFMTCVLSCEKISGFNYVPFWRSITTIYP